MSTHLASMLSVHVKRCCCAESFSRLGQHVSPDNKYTTKTLQHLSRTRRNTLCTECERRFCHASQQSNIIVDLLRVDTSDNKHVRKRSKNSQPRKKQKAFIILKKKQPPLAIFQRACVYLLPLDCICNHKQQQQQRVTSGTVTSRGPTNAFGRFGLSTLFLAHKNSVSLQINKRLPTGLTTSHPAQAYLSPPPTDPAPPPP